MGISRPRYYRILKRTAMGPDKERSSYDRVQTNLAAARKVSASFVKYGRMLVMHSICWSHILSNATRYSLGRYIYPYDKYSRLVI